MVSPLYFYLYCLLSVLCPVALGRDCLVFGSIGNAAADGKRLRVIDALAL
jgi:hypothetical protein